MANTFRARVANKRDTSANWTTANPVLLNGEIIIVDTSAGEVRCKIGDGVKHYTELPFNDEAMKNLVDSAREEFKSYTDEQMACFVDITSEEVRALFYN